MEGVMFGGYSLAEHLAKSGLALKFKFWGK